MDERKTRRSFVKRLLSFMAFGAGSMASVNNRIGLGNPFRGAVKAQAAAATGKGIKKIGVEEHFPDGAENQLDERLREMDEAGIQMQVLSENLRPDDESPPEKAKAWAMAKNNTFAKVIDKYPDRFSAFAAVALHEPEEAARELERAVTQLGLKGSLIGGRRTFLDEPEYGVFLETAERLDVPIYVHPSTFKLEPYLKYPILSRSMWGFSAEAGLHAMRLILGGVFEKYPRLQIILGHMGENIPFQLWRLDNRWINEKDGREGGFSADASVANMKKLPSDYFKQHFYVSTSGMFWEPALQLTVEAMGVDRVLFAVDYPAESNVVGARFIESVNFSNEDKEKICHLNAERLLKI